MLETVIARLPSVAGPCEFDILTTYPDADAPKVPEGAPARVVGLQPLRLALVETPVAVLACLARSLRLPLVWVRSRACRSMLDADVVVDVAGISFVDGRGVPITIYNALMTGLSLLLGTPTVKAAQALGPFETQPNRFLARLVLPKLAMICARGARTREHLDSLGLTNVTDVADLAFSLDEAGELPGDVVRALDGAGKYIVLMPSAVVKGLFQAQGGNYVEAVASLARQLRRDTRLSVVIAPHSYRAGKEEGRMNDGPVCREVASTCADDPGIIGLDADLSAGELRLLVANSEVLVTSRFHAMISGLATCTPTVVVGWSHKYREVLDDFGLAEFALDSKELSDPAVIVGLVRRALAEADSLAVQMARALEPVKKRSWRNFEVIAAAVRR